VGVGKEQRLHDISFVGIDSRVPLSFVSMKYPTSFFNS